jgi:16S rRNA (adenine1518-N6/adenine1519-N6)-dimethyltransferase
LTPLRELIARFELRADRRLGQHFLLDPGLLDRIAQAAGDLEGRTVVEVGPGPGGLTRALLARRPRLLIAIERDPRCIAALAELSAAASDRLRLIEGDAREVDLASLSADRLSVVANLPYNVGTPLLLAWLARLESIDQLTLMFQREVALRLAAPPGGHAYGRLSVLVQWLCEVRCLFHLPARAFLPPPKVASTLVGLTPRAQPLAPADKDMLERVLKAAFGQRRKMLRSSLRGLVSDPEPLFAAAGIEPTARAEQIDVVGFCRLAEAYRTLAQSGQLNRAARGTARRTRRAPAGDGA